MSGPDKHACLTVLADDGEKLDLFREALSRIARIRVAERLQSGGAGLAWALAVRPVVQILRLELCPGPVAANGEARPLSAREVDVLRLLAQGLSYDEMVGASAWPSTRSRATSRAPTASSPSTRRPRR